MIVVIYHNEHEMFGTVDERVVGPFDNQEAAEGWLMTLRDSLNADRDLEDDGHFVLTPDGYLGCDDDAPDYIQDQEVWCEIWAQITTTVPPEAAS